MNGWESVQESDFFRRDESGRRGHTYKLFKTRMRLYIAKFSFDNRVYEQWNHLPGDVVSSSSVNIFKGKLDNKLRAIGGFKEFFNFVPDKTIGRVCSCELADGYQVYQVNQGGTKRWRTDAF